MIFCAVWDPKPQLRESAVNAVRMALWVTSQRETSAAIRQQGIGIIKCHIKSYQVFCNSKRHVGWRTSLRIIVIRYRFRTGTVRLCEYLRYLYTCGLVLRGPSRSMMRTSG